MTNAERMREWYKRPGNKERQRATKEAYKLANPELWKAQKIAGAERYRTKNREKINARVSAKRAKYRAQVITAYGGHCSCPGCHVHHAELLTIDHISGGAHHRQNKSNRSSSDFYLKIIKARFPPDYQLHCGSCNLAKSNKNACPLAGQEH